MKAYKLLFNPPEPVTRESLLTWLADTGYIEGYIHKTISPMDANLTEDYIGEVYLQICSIDPDKLIEIWNKGKGKFVNYIKSLINNTIHSQNSYCYKNCKKGRHSEIFLDDIGWQCLSSGQKASAVIYYPEKIYSEDSDHFSIKRAEEEIEIKLEEDAIEER